MDNPWIAALVALFLWWFATGILLVAVRLADRAGGRAHLALTLGTLPLLGVGIWALGASLADPGIMGVYLAFLAALAIWGWIELAFLTGVIAGPNRRDCPAHLPEWERFIRAWGTLAYHEMALVFALIAIGLVSQGAENAFAFWTFAVLFFARVSAKLNLYFGVPRINVEFLPARLSHLASHFRIAPINWVFPISVSALTFAVACWLERLWAAPDAATATGFALLAALSALALLEHWLMVLPLPDAKLWRWLLPAETPRAAPAPHSRKTSTG